MDKIRLKNIKLYAYHGVSPEEQKLGQRFELDIEITTDFSSAVKNDNLDESVDYENVFNKTRDIFCKNKWKLLETAADAIARELAALVKVQHVNVKIRKMNPPIPGFIGCFEVDINLDSST